MADIQSFGNILMGNLEKVIVGKRQSIELIVIGLLCQGHVLIEDVPGVGKTVLARSLAKSIGCSFPSDVTGVSVYNPSKRIFEFRPGPIFAQIVLIDEINRATPKTQAALLESMEERQVTVDGTTHLLPSPFMVLATQNPIEYEGTFPLPEAQLDRFLLRVRLGYPSMNDEIEVLNRQQLRHPIENLQSVIALRELRVAMQKIKKIYVAESIKRYVVELTNRTRLYADVYLGASPRGSLALFRTGQVAAALAGRDYVLPDDIKKLAVSVLAHRIIIGPAARLRELSAEKIVEEIIDNTSVPGGEFKAI
jgi:MoxR-like ATPase